MHWKINKTVQLIAFLFCLSLIPSAKAWENHVGLSYLALKNMPEISQQPIISAESLASFLNKEGPGLVNILQENEQWSRARIDDYPALPDALAFKSISGTIPLITQFIQAIRVNPTLKFPLFIQYPRGVAHRIHRPLDKAAVMLAEMVDSAWMSLPNPPLEKVIEGEKVSPLEIITSASDEPDYGMDINLWDNNGAGSNPYHWGDQPFGNPTVSFGTQAPFHMGFYYESPIIYKLAPSIKRTYVEYRIHLFLSLSHYAFRTKHPYWGYRFLGWALHYIQDLTQPYHSTLAPNFSTAKIIFSNLQKLMGRPTPQQDIIQLISNRHFSLENYVNNLIDDLMIQKKNNHPLLLALANQKQDGHYPFYNNLYPREIIAKESNAAANDLDTLVQNVFPQKYVTDPNYIFYTTEPHVDLWKAVNDSPQKNSAPLNAKLIELLINLGAHTRNTVRSLFYSRPH